MGGSSSRFVKKERWSIVVPEINGPINSVELKASDGTKATLSWEIDKSKNRAEGTNPLPEERAPSTQRSGAQRSSAVPYLAQNGLQRSLNQAALIEGSVEQKTYFKIPIPGDHDFFRAAYLFNQAARQFNIEYAIVGGLSARILGGSRPTQSLDILIAPVIWGNISPVRPFIDELFDSNPQILNYTLPNRCGHIVVTDRNVGVPIKFMNCVENAYDFPDLVAPLRPDGTRQGGDDPEVTWSYKYIYSSGRYEKCLVPVLLPRLLLQQRVLHFTRPQEKDSLMRKKNDVKDIIVYLGALYGSENESFTTEEGQILLPKILEVLRFAELYWLLGGLEVAKWQWINIPLMEGDWRD
jgi:hypothetical protein